MDLDNIEQYLEQAIKKKKKETFLKKIWQWSVVPVFEGFVQTILLGVGGHIATKLVRTIRPKRNP